MSTMDLSVKNTQIYTMRDLNQRTAQVLQEINDAGEPALVTRHGRFVALITPLLNRGLERRLVAAAVEAGEPLDEDENSPGEGQGVYNAEEVAEQLGVALPDARHR